MKKVTFITGNQNKADYLSKYLGFEVGHIKLDLDELQSLDLEKIVEHKVKQAYEKIKTPVIVEDVSLEFEAMGSLPGTFIKFFLEEMSLDEVCKLVDGKSRNAIAKTVFGYYDGNIFKLFRAELKGFVSNIPKGDNGFGWDKIFIPEGYNITRAEMDEENDRITYLKIKPFKELKNFLETI